MNIFKNILPFALAASLVWVAPSAPPNLDGAKSAAQTSVTSKWIPTNPGGGGAFSNVGAGPTGIIVAASDLSGVYVSADNGAHWRNVGALQGLLPTHASSVGFDTQDGNIIYVGTENGLYRSADAANTFASVLNGGFVSAVQMASANVNVGYAARNSAWNAADGKVYRTTDRGLTWQQVSANLPTNLDILKLLVSPFDANVVYLVSGQARFAAGPAQVYRSLDGGVNWQQVAASITDPIMDIAISPASATTLYVSTFPANGNIGLTYKSTNDGAAWAQVAARGGVLWMNKNNAALVRLVDVSHNWDWHENSPRIYQSTNAGQTWAELDTVANWEITWRTDHWQYSETFEGPLKTVGVNLSNPDSLLWITSQFAYGTFDGGQTFKQLYATFASPDNWHSTGIDNVVIADLAFSPVDPNKSYIGFYDMGCWRTLDGGRGWHSCNQTEFTGNWNGLGGNVTSIVADPARPDVVWMVSWAQEWSPGVDHSFILQSKDSGTIGSWVDRSQGIVTQTLEVGGLSVDATSPITQRVLFVTVLGDVYRSANDGASWAQVFDCNGCRFTAVDRFNGNVVYAGGEGGLWRSLAGGAAGTWSAIGLPEMAGPGNCAGWVNQWCWQGVYDIETDPNTPNRVYVAAYGAGKGAYVSSNQGATWQKILTDDYLRAVAITPGDASRIYAGSSSALYAGGYNPSSHGVLVSTNGGASWAAANEGMSWPFASAIRVSPSDPSRVIMASPGPGMHERQFAGMTNLPGANLIQNGDFTQGADGWGAWGTNGQTTNNELCVWPAATTNLWDAGVEQGGFPLVQGKRYQVGFSAWSPVTTTVHPIVGLNQSPWTIYKDEFITLPAGALQSYTFDFTMTNASDPAAGFFLHFGGSSASILCFNNFRVAAFDPASIQGKVTNSAGAALAGVQVDGYALMQGQWVLAGTAFTNASGDYQLGGLPPGTYRVKFSKPGYTTEYFDNGDSLSNSVSLGLNTGMNLTGVNAALAGGGLAHFVFLPNTVRSASAGW